ncbi:MAG: glycosyltransferase family 4 protein [Nitrospirota bacterium]
MKRALIFIDWYLPGFKAGGQIPSVANLIRLLKNDIDFSIITSDRDLGDNKPYEGIELDKWIITYGVRIKYISRKAQTCKTFRNIISEEDPDIIYFNSFFSFYYTIVPLYYAKRIRPDAKIILAPRGMLAEEALKIKSLKKRFFIQLIKITGLYNNLLWHASTDLEMKEIKAVLGENAKVKSASDLSFSLDIISKSDIIKKNGEATFFYLSRITEKKNLLGAIKMLDKINLGEVIFNIIGPIENQDYWAKCQDSINSLNSNITVNYREAIPNYRIKEELETYHFLLFPTFNENYGHVIAESLALGKPVIISDNTPWKNLESKKAGWDIPLKSEAKFSDAINYCIKMSQEDYDLWSSSSVKYVMKRIMSPRIIEDNRSLFLDQ